MLTAAFSYSMATNLTANRYWAFTTETYDRKNMQFDISQFTASVAHFLTTNYRVEVATFVPLSNKPRIEFTKNGLLVKTW